MKKIGLLIGCLLSLGVLVSCQKSQTPNIYIAKYKGNKKCAVSYTFDDGMREHYTMVVPQLEKHGFKGTFWIIGKDINKDEASIIDTTHMSWDNLREMATNGHEISNHSWSHDYLVNIPLEKVKIDIQKNDTVIFDNVGIFPRTFCYPYNGINDEVLKLASVDRVGTRTTQFGVGGDVSKSTLESLREILQQALQSEDWIVAMVHGITYGYDAFGDPSAFWNHLAEVKAMEDSVWVGTFHDVAAYVEERNSTQLEIKQEGDKKFIITPQSSLNKELFTEPLTMVMDEQGINKATITQNGKALAVQIESDRVLFDFDPYGGSIEVSLQ